MAGLGLGAGLMIAMHVLPLRIDRLWEAWGGSQPMTSPWTS
jgi:hypothetical protein